MPAPTATDSNFERTFADLAYARLRDKAPSLLDYLIGFQLVDKNEEETHAVGVFGFKVGKEWVYCPVFFINGELKGHELMYIKNQDAFVPMTEQWVNYILNRRPRVLGEMEETQRGDLGIKQPDFDIFARAPFRGSKMASVDALVAAMSINPRDERYKSLDKRFDLCTVLSSLGKQASINLMATMQKDHKFAEAVLSFYDVKDLIKAAAEKMTQEEANYKDSASFSKCGDCNHYSGEGSCDIVEGDVNASGTCDRFEQKTIKNNIQPIEGITSGKYASADIGMDMLSEKQRKGESTIPKPIVMTRGDDSSAVTKDMSEADKKKLMKDMYVVKDERSDDQKSRLYKTQLAATVNSPDVSGVYDILTASGEPQKTVILKDPFVIGYGRNDPFTIVLDTDSKKFSNFPNSEILTTKYYGPDAFDKWFDGLKDPSSLKVGDVAVLVNPKGSGTCVFEVEQRNSSKDGVAEIRVYGRTCVSSSSSSRRFGGCCAPSMSFDENVDTLVITDKETSGLNQIGKSLFVPKEYKAYVIEKTDRKNYPTSLGSTSGSGMTLGTLGTLVYNAKKASSLRKGIATLELKTDGIRFTPYVNDKSAQAMSKVATIKYLIERQGLDQFDAEMLVKEAHPRKKNQYFVKYAYGEPPNQASFPEPMMGEDSLINAPVQYPQTQTQMLGQPDESGAHEAYGMGDQYLDQNAKNYANSAANQGQKEVLDTAVVTGLVKTMDTDSAVDGYIGDLLLGLDRIGRILFMYYWHNDKFKERYGQQDMAELEDNLRNVFKNLGELALFLKQKTVEPDNANSSEVELTDVLG